MKALLFDTETTGLVGSRQLKLDEQPEIIEFYGCLVDLKKGKIHQEYETLIKPKKEISAKITEITTITNEQLKDAPAFADVAEKILEQLEGAPLVIAHNVSFDKDMIDIEFERLERKVAWPRLLCTVEQTIHIKGHRLSLTKLHQLLFNEPFAGAHRAKEDVQALMRCCIELHKREMI
jgi:DNA polymerase III epsilon subunit family exonuclease